MSFKVYNGFRINPATNMKTLNHFYDFCLSIRKEYNQMADNIWISGIINFAVAKVDDYAVTGKKDSNDNFIAQAFDLFGNEEAESIKTKKYSFTNVGMQLSIAYSNNELVGIAFIDNAEMYKHFFSRNEIMDFHYQDQSDWPEGMTKREWNFRKKIWENIFDDTEYNQSPVQCMLNIDIVQTGLRHTIYDKVKEKFKENCPSYETRVKGALRNYVIQKEFEGQKTELISPADYMAYLKSEKFDSDLTDEKNISIVEKKLKKTVIYEDLIKDI